MNKSTTNRDISDRPEVGIVSRADVGRRVLVNGHFGGILRYLGLVGKKDGIFCGVELDEPVGKNDGTYQGIFHFQCRPGHGVFAPCHKVQLQSEGQEQESSRKRECVDQALSRSAMPGLAASEPIQHFGQPASMDWSLMSMSTGSTNSGCSMAKFQEDLMAHSHATYTVFESDCLMLSDLELNESAAFLGLEEDEQSTGDDRQQEWLVRDLTGGARQVRPDESIILEGPSLGGMDLPIIGSPEPDGTPTPMAEMTDFAMGLYKQQNREKEDWHNRNHLLMEEGEGRRAGANGHSLTNNAGGGGTAANGRREGSDECNNNTPQKHSATSKKGSHQENRTTTGRSRERKPRVPIFQSVQMPVQNLSAAARSKPKQLSKAQVVMEQLKASMDAEKQRPKKEIRSKVQAAIGGTIEKEGEVEKKSQKEQPSPETPPTQQMFVTKLKQKFSGHSKTTQKYDVQTPQTAPVNRAKQNNSKTPSKSNSTTRLAATPCTTKQAENIATTTKSLPRQVLTSKENGNSEPAFEALNKFSNSKRSIKDPKDLNKEAPANSEQNNLANVKKRLEVLKSSATRINVILSSHLSHQESISNEEIASLRGLLDRKEEEHAEELKSVLEKHASAIQKAELDWQERLQQTKEQHKSEVEQLRTSLLATHHNELQSVIGENQSVVDGLKEQLEEQSRNYQTNLEESESARNQRLNDELASLQYALQLKKDEIQEIRKENRHLIVQAEKLPEKEANMTKLSRKNEDLKEELNRQKNIERNLISSINEYRRELDETRTKMKDMEKGKEVLEYQMQELAFGQSQEFPSTPKSRTSSKTRDFSPGKKSGGNVDAPGRHGKSSERPTSSCLPSHGRCPVTFEGDMSRSMDSAMSQSVISCYRQEGRSKQQHTPNKVYTPREAYELKDPPPPPPTSAKRVVNFDKNCSLEQEEEEDPPNEPS